MKYFSVLFLLAPLFTSSAFAYFVAVPADQGPLQYDRPAHILFSGRGATLGTQPQMSALSKAQLYKRNFPGSQVVLISVFENQSNESKLARAGWVFPIKNNLTFVTESAMRELLKFQKIRSLEFFGHNSPSLGTQSDGIGYRFDFRKSSMAQLTPRFDKGAYAIIHGCNSGWISAQTLSKIWKIPVAGSFTGTRFERLHSDGHFYVDEDTRYPNESWATTNPDLGGVSCANGACLRMRTSSGHYNGKWGDFDGPMVSHYKFFCQLDVKECEKRMALSLYSFLAERSLRPQSSYADFRAVAKEYLCPATKDRLKTDDCFRQLELLEQGQGNMQMSFVANDEQLSCNLRSCSAVMTCDDHICKVSDRESKGATTLAQEYLHFLSGFQALSREGL